LTKTLLTAKIQGFSGVYVKITALVLMSVLLCSAIAIAPCLRFASAQTESIIINDDGSITPSTAPIKRVGNLYILTGDTGLIIVKISNITLDGRGHTIQSKIEQTRIIDTGGISLSSVQNVTVKGFSIKNCTFGFKLDYCSNITISGNNITGTWQPLPFSLLPAGIFIWNGDYNIITGNRLENNSYGMYVAEDSEHNVIVGNTISNSIHEGISLYHSSSNTFYHNNFDNTKNVFDSGSEYFGYLSINAWDNGEEGNFWSDYNGNDADRDGIGDTPYNVESSNQDRYPLMKPWEPDTEPPSISMISPENITYNESNITLAFSTSEPTSKISYSLDGQDNVTIIGNITLTDLSNGDHNIIVSAIDEFGNTGVSETVYFTVEVPFPVVPVAAASVIVAVVVLGFLLYFKKRKR
jgi:parallel beta-helix repeat protein